MTAVMRMMAGGRGGRREAGRGAAGGRPGDDMVMTTRLVTKRSQTSVKRSRGWRCREPQLLSTFYLRREEQQMAVVIGNEHGVFLALTGI